MPNDLQIALVWIMIIVVSLFTVYAVGYYKGKSKQLATHKISQRQQRSVLGGLFSEQIAPYLPGFPKDLKISEARFIGKPIDFIIFKGMDEKNIEEVVFVEVKSGKSQLNANEKKLRDVVREKKVRWCEYRVDEKITDWNQK